MLNYSNVLYDNQNVPAVDNGTWTGPWVNIPCRSERTHTSIDAVVEAGTIGYNIEATNDIVKGDVTVIKAETGSDAIVAESYTYFRVRVTSSTAAAKLRVTTDRIGCTLSADRFSSTGIG